MQHMPPWNIRRRTAGQQIWSPCLRVVQPFLHGELFVLLHDVAVWPVEVQRGSDVGAPALDDAPVGVRQDVPLCWLTCMPHQTLFGLGRLQIHFQVHREYLANCFVCLFRRNFVRGTPGSGLDRMSFQKPFTTPYSRACAIGMIQKLL